MAQIYWTIFQVPLPTVAFEVAILYLKYNFSSCTFYILDRVIYATPNSPVQACVSFHALYYAKGTSSRLGATMHAPKVQMMLIQIHSSFLHISDIL